ncbi:GSCFA domain-containing protein [Methylobacterium sp. NEAU 140]|uniref:GSCFA domain-containing protein n=1 Tax=Methylobacterium sp. NEAU 140 TaxID=3064945 RepID=UPI002733722A|nr:GSCFA domain-containing protein [Methylobacterium sp. NEAU 140]MDP4023678.1 GSCFA domain-containing protein [Methylobacterium sp. NEAU 140]
MISSDPFELATDENFDDARYLTANPDVKASGAPARLHFERFGRREGRLQVAGPAREPSRRITVLGNCQAPMLAQCLSAMLPDAEVHGVHLGLSSHEPATRSDLILLQTEFSGLADNPEIIPPRLAGQVRSWPTFLYAGFHPDLVYARAGELPVRTPLHDYSSALMLYGWLRGLTVAQTVGLFHEAVFDRLGYFAYAASADAHFVEDCDRAGLDGAALLAEAKARAPFCHTINHPHLAVVARVAEGVLAAAGLAPAVRGPERFLPDPLLSGPIWPVYPAIAERLGVAGDYVFKTSGLPGRFLDLDGFVAGSFAMYGGHPRSEIRADRLTAQADRYRDLETLVAKAAPRGANPYARLPDRQFWRRAVAGVAPADLDPVAAPAFRLAPRDRIATAGSCFAQHIARTLIDRGFNYHVTEPGPDGAELFSARFGNLYSARQLLQLARRAYGEFQPRDTAWLRPDGRWVDPFRPQVEPAGYAAEADVVRALPGHLAAVRRMFEESDLFIFTVGLTEIWESTRDGAVFPVAPGVVAAPPDPAPYRFANMNAAEVQADLSAFIAFVRARNPGLKMLLTVSPVPLVATYENRHVLVSTTYSKSALRAAVGEVCRAHAEVDYFPSYEIITTWQNGGRYFQDDLRSVSDSGVAHVMRVFGRHYMAGGPAERPPHAGDAALRAEFARAAKILCDEEALDAVAR